ncbi:hypothetical protein [Enterobacter ludwigii]|uniref:hypothetical protein n=1 Tax=Enterobacter ludwigii TaxID=299767 RepID=UPI003F716D03
MRYEELPEPVIEPTLQTGQVAVKEKLSLLAKSGSAMHYLDRGLRHSVSSEKEKFHLTAWEKYSVLVPGEMGVSYSERTSDMNCFFSHKI